MTPLAIQDASHAGQLPIEPVSKRIPTTHLGQDEFLKLLVAQLAHQDPLNPLKDTEFIAQMAQFTSLEQTKAISTDIAQMRSQQQMLQAMSLLGKEVVIQSLEKGLVKGVIQGVDMDGKTPQVVIGDQRYDLSDIAMIQPAKE